MALSLLLFVLTVFQSEELLAYSGYTVPVNITGLGLVHGSEVRVLGKAVEIFLGIPYAQPPVGDRRFRRPEPYPAWQPRVQSAKTQPKTCFQVFDTTFEKALVKMWNPNTDLSEDCLYLNIWRPQIKPDDPKKAVMVWIYGGGFMSGSSTLDVYEARHLALKSDVVVVSMQYRVGPLGFLSMGNDGAPGNMGLLDQQLALRWVVDHIGVFGGDVKRIALFGESAGAASVSFHLLSPLSRDLFQTAIMQSAAATCNWALKSSEDGKRTSLQFAAHLGCNQTTLDLVLGCLREISPERLSVAQFELDDTTSPLLAPAIAFGAIDDDYFLTDFPLKLTPSIARKSIIIGFTEDEGSYFLPYHFADYFPLNPTIDLSDTKYHSVLKKMLGAKLGSANVLVDRVAKDYAHDAAGQKYVHRNAVENFLGDMSFKCPVLEFASSWAGHGGNVYVYQYNHRTSTNPWPDWMGVMHGYEIDVVFGLPFDDNLYYKPEEKEISSLVMKYWSNLAKTGDPNINDDKSKVEKVWPKYTSWGGEVLHLNTTELVKVSKGVRSKQCNLWQELAPKIRLNLGYSGFSVAGGSTLTIVASIASFLIITEVLL